MERPGPKISEYREQRKKASRDRNLKPESADATTARRLLANEIVQMCIYVVRARENVYE